MISVIEPVQEGAYIYHNGFYICGISFVIDPEMEQKFDKLIIPTEIAIKFVDGSLSHDRWFYWNEKLYNNDINKIADGLVLDIIDDKYVRIEENNKANNLWLGIRIYPNTQNIVFTLTSLLVNFKYNEEFLNFVITEKDDPSTVYYVLNVPLQELFENQEWSFILPIEPNKKLDIYTKRLFPNYGIEYPRTIIKEGREVFENVNMVLSLPKNYFIDLQSFDDQVSERGLQAALDRRTGHVTFSVVGTEVEIYKHSMMLIPLLFTMPNDPSLIRFGTTLSIEELSNKSIKIRTPDGFLDHDFDIWSPLVYKNCFRVETVYEKFVNEPIVYDGINLQAVIDKRRKTINFSVIGDLTIEEPFKFDFITVIFVESNKETFRTITAAELKKGLVTFMLADVSIEKNFELMVEKNLFKKAYVRYK